MGTVARADGRDAEGGAPELQALGVHDGGEIDDEGARTDAMHSSYVADRQRYC